MRRTVMLLGFALLLAVLIPGRMTAQQQGAAQTRERPDFSGTWRSSSAPAMTIQQNDQTLTVSAGSDSQTVNLTGAETRVERQGRNFAYTETSQARWVSSALVITKTTVSPIGTWQDLDVLSLDYGNKLTVVKLWTQTTAPLMGTTTATYTRD